MVNVMKTCAVLARGLLPTGNNMARATMRH